MIEYGDGPDDERAYRERVIFQLQQGRAFAVLQKLTDAELIEAARKVAASHGPLSVLISVLLDRFQAHMLKSWQELGEARATVERLAKAKASE